MLGEERSSLERGLIYTPPKRFMYDLKRFIEIRVTLGGCNCAEVSMCERYLIKDRIFEVGDKGQLPQQEIGT